MSIWSVEIDSGGFPSYVGSQECQEVLHQDCTGLQGRWHECEASFEANPQGCCEEGSQKENCKEVGIL